STRSSDTSTCARGPERCYQARPGRAILTPFSVSRWRHMKRREFMALVGGAAALPLSARAQQAARKIPRIGIIDDAPLWDAYRHGRHEHGYVEGKSVAYEYRAAEGKAERLAAAAAELVRLRVDLIATYGTPPSRAAKAATSTIPIVAIAVGDPVAA